MKFTFVILAVLLLLSAADHHRFRHGREDDENHRRNVDRNGDYNNGNEGSDEGSQNHGGRSENNHNRNENYGESEENYGEGEENYGDRNGNNRNENYGSRNGNNGNGNEQNNENQGTANTNNDGTASNTYYGNTSSTSNTNTASSSSNAQGGSKTGGSSTKKAQSTAGSSYIQQCLDNHNEERNSLGLGSVTWNSDLAAASLDWAEQIASAGSLSHSSGRVHVGENVASSTHHDGVDNTVHLIGLWLDEKKDFKNGKYPDISTSGNVHDVGHYSQMIWAATTEIGCATAVGNGDDYICCQYKKSGNVHGQKVY